VKRNDVKRIREVYKTRKASEAWEKDVTGDSGAGGGYLIPPAYEPTLLEVAAPAAVIRSRATVIPVSTRSGEIPSLDQYTAPTGGQGDTAFAGGVVVGWAEEGGTLSETQPTFKMLEWNIRKLGAYTEVPNETVADSAIAIEALLTRLFGTAIAGMEDYAFIRGDGVGKPLGILSADCTIAVTTATNNAFAIADALAMRSRHKAVGGEPAWLIHPGVWPDIGVFEVGTGGAVFLSNVPGGLPQSLLGYPILESEHMPQDDYDDVILGDFSAYVIFDRAGIAVAYSEHAAFTTDKGTWRVTKRLDGQPWLTSTITLADPQGSYTVSPFVYHDD
jgi:HK97 family phage major capsid protein